MTPLRIGRLLEPARPFRDTILRTLPPRALQARTDAVGTYTTSDGIPVKIVFSGRATADWTPGRTRPSA